MSKSNSKKKNNKTEKRSEGLCPFCQSPGVAKAGFRENLFYVKCKENNCCVTDYYSTKEEAKQAWKERKVHLTAAEKIRLSEIAQRRKRDA